MALINICHGCLSPERKLTPIEEHAQLYQQLLLKKSNSKIKKLLMCWECHKILINIEAFRLKITQAQILLCSKTLPFVNVLSNLSMLTKVDDYHLIIYDDEKNCVTPTEVAVEVKKEKEESYEYGKKGDVDENIAHIKEEFKYDDGFDEASDDFNDNSSAFNGVNDINGFNSVNDINGIKELEVLVPNKVVEKKEIKVEKRRKKRGALKQKYRTIIIDDIQDKRSLYDIIHIDQKDAAMELKKKLEKRRKFRCSLCYSGFSQQQHYDRHMRRLHNQRNKYVCDVCGCRFADVRGVRRHVATHFARYACRLCAQQFGARNKVYEHFKHGPHARQMECVKCEQRFDCRKRREFYEHYRNMHDYLVCDYCGSRRSTKSRLAKHIQARHTDNRCDTCNIPFSSPHALKKHNERKHITDASERNYCVECDAQFANSLLYDEHVSRSTRHNPRPRVKCLGCDRTYSKHIYMRNHYELVHLKASRFVCPLCDKKCLNGFRLRCHIKYYHEKVPKPKNFICNYCGKAFNTRRILNNHVRTHTGERPYACALCPAAFAQSTPLKTHMRSAHK